MHSQHKLKAIQFMGFFVFCTLIVALPNFISLLIHFDYIKTKHCSLEIFKSELTFVLNYSSDSSPIVLNSCLAKLKDCRLWSFIIIVENATRK